MKTIGLLSGKGGAGKTTTAINLAAHFRVGGIRELIPLHENLMNTFSMPNLKSFKKSGRHRS